MTRRRVAIAPSLGLACLWLAGACSSSTATTTPDFGGDCTHVAAASETVTVSDDYGPLEGTLDVPPACERMPVVLVLSGSGPEDRDGNSPGASGQTDMYKLLAHGLRDQGFAVLRFDDPGVAHSAKAFPSSEAKITYELEIDAASLWLPLLHADPRFGPVVAAGHSQGSLTAILLAERGRVDAVISLAGAGRPIDQVLREQLLPQLTTEELARLDAVLAKLKAGMLAGPQDPPLDQLFRVSVQPYYISWMKYDPKAEVAKLAAPTLLVQGRTDAQVSVADAQLLAAGKPDAQLTLIDDMCHVLKQASDPDLATQSAQYAIFGSVDPAASRAGAGPRCVLADAARARSARRGAVNDDRLTGRSGRRRVGR